MLKREMTSRKSSSMVFIILTLILSSFFSTLKAQNPNGFRGVNPSPYKFIGMWCDSTNKDYQEHRPVLQYIPPYSYSMGIDELLGYVALDSLLRNSTDQSVLNLIERSRSSNDTVREVMRLLYKVVDFDPFSFHQYLLETTLHHKSSKSLGLSSANMSGDTLKYKPLYGSYKCRGEVIPSITERLYDTTHLFSTCALFSAASSDFVLRLRIVSIDSMLDKYYKFDTIGTVRRRYIYRACAEVLDTLKGRRFSNYASESLIAKNKTQTFSSVIYFTYTARMYDGVTGNSSAIDGSTSSLKNFIPDTAFSSYESDGTVTFRLIPEQEIVGFIRLQDRLIDSSYDYFEMMLDPRCSLMALPIKNGNVYDVNHVWSTNDFLPYTTWKEKYSEIKTAILLKVY